MNWRELVDIEELHAPAGNLESLNAALAYLDDMEVP